MTNKRHFDRIDIAKGIGIILVVFAHTIVPQIRENSLAAKFVWIFIYNFHMPLFFFLSGYLFEKGFTKYTDKGRFILNKLKYLMIPYLTFSVFAYLFIRFALNIAPLASVLENGGYEVVGIKDAVLQILTYNGHTDRHLWFVYSLFLVFVLNILMPKVMKSKIALPLLAVLYISKARIHYFGILNYTVDTLFFFSLARVIAEKEDFKVNNIFTAIVFIVTNCIYSYFYIHVMPAFIKDMLYLVRIMSAISGILLVCEISKFIEHKKISRFFKEIGSYSYDIYLMHAPFLVSGLMGILLSYSSLPPMLCCTVVLIVGIAVPYLISKFIIRKMSLFSIPILGKNFSVNNKNVLCTK